MEFDLLPGLVVQGLSGLCCLPTQCAVDPRIGCAFHDLLEGYLPDAMQVAAWAAWGVVWDLPRIRQHRRGGSEPCVVRGRTSVRYQSIAGEHTLRQELAKCHDHAFTLELLLTTMQTVSEDCSSAFHHLGVLSRCSRSYLYALALQVCLCLCRANASFTVNNEILERTETEIQQTSMASQRSDDVLELISMAVSNRSARSSMCHTILFR